MYGVGKVKSGMKAYKQSTTIYYLIVQSVIYNGHERLTKVYLILFTFAHNIKNHILYVRDVLLFEINLFSGSNRITKESFI